MTQYILRRLVWLVFVMLGMTLVVFSVTHLIPADPARVVAGETATKEAVERIRQDLGLDKPLPEQYLNYLLGLLQGDLGKSILTGRPVIEDIKDYFPATLELALVSMLVALGVGLTLGIFSALQQGRVVDNVLRLLSTLWVAMPVFWFALMLQIFFYGRLSWFPFGGRLPQNMEPPPHVTGMFTVDAILGLQFTALPEILRHLVLPVTAVALGRVAELARMTRSSMLEVLSKDYIRTARGKGLAERAVILRHGLKNAALPILTIAGVQFGHMLGGAVLVEAIFQWPGMGRYAVNSVTSVDFPAIIGVSIIASAVFVLINLLIDLMYRFVDPRIRY